MSHFSQVFPYSILDLLLFLFLLLLMLLFLLPLLLLISSDLLHLTLLLFLI